MWVTVILLYIRDADIKIIFSTFLDKIAWNSLRDKGRKTKYIATTNLDFNERRGDCLTQISNGLVLASKMVVKDKIF